MFSEILGRFLKSPIKAWFLYAFPWWALIPLGTFLLFDAHYSREISDTKRLQDEVVDQENSLLEVASNQVIRSTLIIRNNTQSIMTNNNLAPEEQQKLLSQNFFAVSSAYPQYMQIRIILPDGNEWVRVDNDARASNAGVIRRSHEMQNKAERYYFREGMKLDKDAIFLTPFDLNLEQGKVEQPYRSTLRSVTQLRDVSGAVIGLFVLNLDGSYLLDREHRSENSMVINSDGYWLLSTDESQEWGFMFNRPDDRFPLKFPDVWEQMTQSYSTSGQFLNYQGLWTYKRLTMGNSEEFVLKSTVIYTVSLVTDIVQLRKQLMWRYSVIALLILIVMTALAYTLAKATTALDKKSKELNATNQELEYVIEQLQLSKEELIRTEKLSSLGLLVAGIAHELNTPIGSAMLTFRSMRERLAEMLHSFNSGAMKRSDLDRFLHQQNEGLELANEGLNRAGLLIQQFKQVASDRANATCHHFDLAEEVEKISALMKNQIHHSPHQLILNIPPNIKMVSYPGPLGQVIQNLIQNSLVHAFDDGMSGVIEVTATPPVNGFVDIFVTDNGGGIPTEYLNTIFDPFFTTKRNQGGTGLGLHIVHNIVHGVLGGTIRVEKGVNGVGTRLVLHLPLNNEGGAVAS